MIIVEEPHYLGTRIGIMDPQSVALLHHLARGKGLGLFPLGEWDD